MKTKNLFLSVAATMLIGFGSLANATLLSDFQYTGNVTITGTGNGSGANNGDNDNSTMNFVWVIDENVGNFHNITHFAGATVTSGSGTIFGGPGLGDIDMDIDFVSDLANLINEGHTDFPTGESTPSISGSPLVFTTSIFKSLFGTIIDSDLEVHTFDFTGNIITMDLVEVQNIGGNFTLGGILADPVANADGIFTRGFQINAQVSAVPVPAAVWLFGSALLGLAGARRKAA